MKYIFIILILISILLIGCDSNYVLADTVPETVVVTQIVTQEVTVEDTAKIEQLELELQQYKDLIGNLNELLSNVYEVRGELSNGAWTGGTGFSIKYNNKYYLITAGHVIDNEYGIFKNLGFKVNNEWIYPKLLSYENDFNIGKDYSIFYSDKITDGFEIGKFELPVYILGYGKLNTIREMEIGTQGESGSPIINLNGEVVGIMTGGVVNINKITKTIDNF